MGGGVAIPVVPVQRTVSPSGKDDTAAIQVAIDAVSGMPATNGVRGALLLAPGTFTLDGTLNVTTGGVVLRGSGSGSGGTVIQVQGSSRAAVTVNGSGSLSTTGSQAITDAYVPSGATTFSVANASPAIPAGTYDSRSTPVAMSSLYLAQLCERLGPEALAAIGYP